MTSSEAGRAVASNLQARRQQLAADAREQARADLAAQRVDTTTPLFPKTIGKAPLETPPDPPKAPAPAPEIAKPAKTIALATTIAYRDYEITITATGFTLDAFCDMLDKRLGVVSE